MCCCWGFFLTLSLSHDTSTSARHEHSCSKYWNKCKWTLTLLTLTFMRVGAKLGVSVRLSMNLCTIEISIYYYYYYYYWSSLIFNWMSSSSTHQNGLWVQKEAWSGWQLCFVDLCLPMCSIGIICYKAEHLWPILMIVVVLTFACFVVIWLW